MYTLKPLRIKSKKSPLTLSKTNIAEIVRDKPTDHCTSRDLKTQDMIKRILSKIVKFRRSETNLRLRIRLKTLNEFFKSDLMIAYIARATRGAKHRIYFLMNPKKDGLVETSIFETYSEYSKYSLIKLNCTWVEIKLSMKNDLY